MELITLTLMYKQTDTHTVIGAGCIIYKDVPANTVVVNKQELVMKNLAKDGKDAIIWKQALLR